MVWMKEELGDKKTYDKGVHCFLWGDVAESLLSRWEVPYGNHQGRSHREDGLR